MEKHPTTAYTWQSLLSRFRLIALIAYTQTALISRFSARTVIAS